MSATQHIAARRPAPSAAADRRPGLNSPRLLTLMRAAVHRLDLDLEDRAVVTEAATGAYAVTPVVAALAGARSIRALARDCRHGTADQAVAWTRALAECAGVEDRIEFVADKADAGLAKADIVTNSGHLRPLDAQTIGQMRRGAAIPLMYEAWEHRAGDVDLEACRRCGIRVGGTNERHPAVDVFSFLGVMAVKLLMDAGISVYSSRLLVLCDNPFCTSIQRGLSAAGATVEVREQMADGAVDPGWDAVLVAAQPREIPVLHAADVEMLAAHAPGAVVAQLWGDLPRDRLRAAGVPVWPETAPPPGHMGVLPSSVGPEPVVRLQAAGLKVGEVLCRAAPPGMGCDHDYVQWV
jgi:hypothetical protein